MKACCAVLLLILVRMPIQASRCDLDIYLETQVPLPDRPLPDPRPQVAAMFHSIGVNVRLRAGNMDHETAQDCGTPISVQLEDSAGYTGTAEALAYTISGLPAGPSIHVFLDHIVGHGRDQVFAGRLLAHVLAHEITHALEQDGRHSSRGIMKAQWSHQDYQEMRWRPLAFTPEDARQIHDGLRKWHGQTSPITDDNCPEE